MPVMRARELIVKKKTIIKAGEWKSGQTMPKTAFPLSPTRSYRLGPRWTWRVDVLECAGIECRLVTAFEPMKQTCVAWLSCKRGSGGAYALVAALEFHGDHPGWHCHSVCGKIADIKIGPTRPPGSVRLPKVGAHHRKMNIVFNEREALEKAFSFYRVESGTPGTLL
ncbi:hypothetical protein [Bradyrhizobium sp. USDA 3256]